MSQTRRLAAILATDVAGYSRLIGGEDRDETAGLAHVSSPAAKRRPDKKSSRSSGFRSSTTLGGGTT